MIKILSILIALISFVNPSAFKESQISNLMQQVNQQIKKNNEEIDTKDLYYLHEALISLKDENKSPYKNTCQKLMQIDIKVLSTSQQFFYYKLSKLIECNQIQFNEQLFTKTDSPKLLEAYRSIILRNIYGVQSKQKLEEFCGKINEFIDLNGAGRSIRKSMDQSYEYSYIAIELAVLCFDNGFKSQKSIAHFNQAIKSINLNAVSLNKDMKGIFEGNNYVFTTAQIVHQMFIINKYLENQSLLDELYSYINFLYDQINYLSQNSEKAAVYKLFKILNGYPRFSLEKSKFVGSQNNQIIQLNAENFFGEKIDSKLLKNVQINGFIQLHDQTKLKLAQFSFKEDSSFITKFDPTHFRDITKYDLYLDINIEKKTYKNNMQIRLVMPAFIDNIAFEVTQSNREPQSLSKAPNFKQQPKIYKANQNSFIHVALNIEQHSKKNINIKQVAVRLRNPIHNNATNLVNAHLDKSTLQYKATIDLGDPDHILPYNGLYDCEIIIADESLSENIKKVFAKFEITFRKPANGPPTSEVDYVLPKLIKHYFPPPPKRPHFIVTTIFNILLISAIALFFFIYGKMNLNLSEANSLLKLGFIAIIMVNVSVLIIFWTYINLIQTLTILAILVIPCIIIGNKSLTEFILEKNE